MKERDEFLKDFSKDIRELRTLKKKKMTDFSSSSDMEYTTLYRAENRNKNMYIYTAYKILKNLDIDLLDILNKEIKKLK